MPVCICGMHRSGTSMVARILQKCGLYLGEDDDLMKAGPDNPDGYWENTKFVRVNEEILSRLGGAWDFPPVVPVDWDDQTLPETRAAAEDLVQGFSHHRWWGWKDPRNSLTLPFWASICPDLKVVICLRNPLEVAWSLRKRNHLSCVFSLSLWEYYNASLLQFTCPENRIITHYDSYFSEPADEIERLIRFLDATVPEKAISDSRKAIAPKRRHHQFTVDDLNGTDVSPDLRRLYLEMVAQSSWHEPNGRSDEPVEMTHGTALGHAGPGHSATEIHEMRDARWRRSVTEREVRMRNVDTSDVGTDYRHHELETLRAETSSSLATVQNLQEQVATIQSRIDGLEVRHDTVMQAITLLTTRLVSLADKTDNIVSVEENLQHRLEEVHEHSSMRDDQIQEILYDVEAKIGAALNGKTAPAKNKYLQMVRRVREIVRFNLAPDANVLVVSKGDDRLLQLYGRPASHFPQSLDGTYAGFYPADSLAAIAHLEALRSKGAQFLVFPATAFWWFQHYEKFHQYLEHHYPAITGQDGGCAIYALQKPAASENGTWQAAFDDVIAECQERLGRAPSILDWYTGLDLAAGFPGYTVFSPPTSDQTLPYLDQSIDVVSMLSQDEQLTHEARRVANAAVVSISPDRNAGGGQHQLSVEMIGEGRTTGLPSASIVIPSYNGVGFTEACLISLLETVPSNLTVEIIVVDDASSDDTQARLKPLAKADKRLRLLRNRKNMGFVATCNRGARAAKNDIVILLNNDTLPLPGWLTPLLRTFQTHPDAGAVGGKLIYPDGRLQEAGAVVFSDGSAANFGKFDASPDASLYNYVREVDYCSGALLATWRSVFLELGGLDTRYRPIYYEEADYCFRLRDAGHRVYYQPESAIVHLEGATSGTDLSTGDKRYQAVNRAKFVERWSDVLPRQPANPGKFNEATWQALAVRYEREGDDD